MQLGWQSLAGHKRASVSQPLPLSPQAKALEPVSQRRGLTREVLVFGVGRAEALNTVVFTVDEHRTRDWSAAAGLGAHGQHQAPTSSISYPCSEPRSGFPCEGSSLCPDPVRTGVLAQTHWASLGQLLPDLEGLALKTKVRNLLPRHSADISWWIMGLVNTYQHLNPCLCPQTFSKDLLYITCYAKMYTRHLAKFLNSQVNSPFLRMRSQKPKEVKSPAHCPQSNSCGLQES